MRNQSGVLLLAALIAAVPAAASANTTAAPAPATYPTTTTTTTTTTTMAPATPDAPATATVKTTTVTASHTGDLDPLWQVEARAGFGLALGGAGETMSRRTTPLTIEALVSVAIQDVPPLYAFGGLAVETMDRNGIGATAGITLRPHGGAWRLSGGGIAMVAPYSLYGATVSTGVCHRAVFGYELCGDVQLTAFFAGNDLANDHAVTQAQLVLGVVFDAI